MKKNSLYWICYNIVSVFFIFYFYFFCHEACRILAPQPGIDSSLVAFEGEVLTTGPPGNSLFLSSNNTEFCHNGIWIGGYGEIKGTAEESICKFITSWTLKVTFIFSTHCNFTNYRYQWFYTHWTHFLAKGCIDHSFEDILLETWNISN